MQPEPMNPMKKNTKTKTLIVTKTIRYEFEVPASMPEDEATLKRFFGRLHDPWAGADFAAVTERDFEVESQTAVTESRTKIESSVAE